MCDSFVAAVYMKQSVLRVTRDELQATVVVPHIPWCSYYTGEPARVVYSRCPVYSISDCVIM